MNKSLKNMARFGRSISALAAVAGAAIGLILGPRASHAAGTWTPLVNGAPGNIALMLLLPNGTVMCANNLSSFAGFNDGYGNGWYLLTPDANGSYVNGTWTTLASMQDTRLYYSSQVLTNGTVLVAGGEYGSGSCGAELYDPIANTWTPCDPQSSLLNPNMTAPFVTNLTEGFYDSISEILPSGQVMISPVAGNTFGQILIFDPASATWSAGSTTLNDNNQDEASWVKLPDDSILTLDPGGESAERFITSSGQWKPDKAPPVSTYDSYGEEGPAFLVHFFQLQANSDEFLLVTQALFFGGNGNTLFYAPTGNATKGTWIPGATMPLDPQGNQLGPRDAAAAEMVNGKILCTAGDPETGPEGPNEQWPGPTFFFEFDPGANAFTPVSSPTGGSTDNVQCYETTMLDLPDGTVLYAHQGTDLYVYTPDGQPLPFKPTISSITVNNDGSFQLVGTGLNGISEGAAYGDDAQMNSNYPLVRMTNCASGQVVYAQTFNWNSTSVTTGTRPITTEFMPNVFAGGVYSLVVSASGFVSDPVKFYGPVWVDFYATDLDYQFGTFQYPFATIAQATNTVAKGGTVYIRPGTTSETISISKPMTLMAVGGAATIGQQ